MVRTWAVAVAVGATALGGVGPAPAASPTVIVITGWAVIKVDEGCLARVVQKDY